MSNVKYLGAAALLALCVGLSAGAALAGLDWSPTADNIPSAMGWDQSLSATISSENIGTAADDGDDTWPSTSGIAAVEGSAPYSKVDRWGTVDVPIAGPVQKTDSDFQGLYTWEFPMVAPPISTLKYATPYTPTTPPAPFAVSGKWAMTQSGVVQDTLALAGNDVTIRRFPDTMIGVPLNDWATPQIEECAGRVPQIVGGYPDGKYHPEIVVTRDQMAEFIRRAANIATGANTGQFVDVPLGFWAEGGIFGLVNANIVGGYDATHYQPAWAVTRDQMAVFIARGLCGGMDKVPVIPTPGAEALFTDIPVGFWAYDGIAYCISKNVVGGYPDGSYQPTWKVTRDQMAVFIYRSFIAPTPSVVVLAGPAVTSHVTDGQVGWPVATSGESASPGTAYVALDVLRLGEADVTVDLALMDGTVEVWSDSVTKSAAEVSTAKAAAALSGVPYLYLTKAIPTGLPDGDYTLVAKVNGMEIGRKPTFSIAPATPPVTPTVSVWHPTDVIPGNSAGAIASGDATALAVADGSYVVDNPATSGQVGVTGLQAEGPLPAGVTVANTKVMKLEIVYKTSVADPAGIGPSLMSSGSSGGKRYCASPPSSPDVDTSFVWETANEAKIADALTTDAPDFHMIYCNTVCTQPYAGPDYTLSVDLMEATFTSK